MSEWIAVKQRMPPKKVPVDLWIEGDATTVGFYDPARGRACTSGRTCNWIWNGERWASPEGLMPYLTRGVIVTHWMNRPAPPTT